LILAKASTTERQLEMQPAQRAGSLGARLVILDEAAGDADLAQPLLVKGFAEPAAVIDMPSRKDEPRHIHRRHRRLAPQMLLARDGAILQMD
jgi:hypothetical protein